MRSLGMAVAGLLLAAALAPAQEAVQDLEELGEPISIEDPSGRALDAFHAALRRAEAGEDQARVLLYGASHVAADMFPDVLRDRLQARFGDAGHGFVLPARVWRHYRHQDVDVDSPWRSWTRLRVPTRDRDETLLGLAGMAVETEAAGAWGRVELGSTRTSRFELYTLRRPGGGSAVVRIDDQRVRRIRTRGSAVEPGYEVFTVSDGPHTFEVRAVGDGPVRFFGVAAEREVPGVVVDTLGINGARARSHLRWDADLHRAHLRRRRPDLVVLAYGTNESGDIHRRIERYERTLRQVVGRIRETVPEASCVLIGPSDRPVQRGPELYERPRTAAIIAVQRRVAAEAGCGFFDLVAFSGGPMSIVDWAENDPPYAQEDLVHFNARGYRRLGEVLHDALLEGYDAAE
jgi:lysophospholipase L1-like esterase